MSKEVNITACVCLFICIYAKSKWGSVLGQKPSSIQVFGKSVLYFLFNPAGKPMNHPTKTNSWKHCPLSCYCDFIYKHKIFWFLLLFTLYIPLVVLISWSRAFSDLRGYIYIFHLFNHLFEKVGEQMKTCLSLVKFHCRCVSLSEPEMCAFLLVVLPYPRLG